MQLIHNLPAVENRGLPIQLRGVSRRFFIRGREPFLAVSDVNLNILAGSFVSVVGPSGCGKSTLLSLVAGLHSPSAGDVVIDGQSNMGVRRDVGMMFQRDALLPWRTILDNVALPLRFRGVSKVESRSRAADWLKLVNMAGFERSYPHQLSGGMRKRVSMAQTLVYEPSVVLMDEPFSALDYQTRQQMHAELLDLWERHRPTVLFITHDLDEAIALSDRVTLMSACPGTIKEVVDIPLARPRDIQRVRFEDAFKKTFDQLWGHLKDEVQPAQKRLAR